jgi:hypothetical protein
MNRFIFLTLLFPFFTLSIYSQTLHLYGGKNHDVYLGCLNCDKYNSNSIWNSYGTYGSKYNSISIWNSYGTYGSKYNSSSPWNSYSNDPPVVVDKDGNFYGYFTLNAYKNNRAEFGLALTIYKYYDLIMDDVSKWHDKIFE